VSDATDKQLEEALPCNMRCSPGITHSVHCFAAHRPAVRALIDALIAGAYLAAESDLARLSEAAAPESETRANLKMASIRTRDMIPAAARLALEERDRRVAYQAKLDVLIEFQKAHELGYDSFTYFDFADIGSNYSEKLLERMIAAHRAAVQEKPRET
jgi:hypothetical protein